MERSSSKDETNSFSNYITQLEKALICTATCIEDHSEKTTLFDIVHNIRGKKSLRYKIKALHLIQLFLIDNKIVQEIYFLITKIISRE